MQIRDSYVWHAKEIGLLEVRGDELIAGPHCDDDARLRAAEHGDRIELTFEIRGAHKGDCYEAANVTLQQPMAGRQLVDTQTGEQPPLDRRADQDLEH